jgi:hypothetical protein
VGFRHHLPPSRHGTSCVFAQDRPTALGRKHGAENTAPQNAPTNLADDILEGAEAITVFLFGSRAFRRKVYYLAECSKLPIFRLGSMLCARKSVLLQFISVQEDRVLS